MTPFSMLARQWALALGFGLLAVIAVLFTRFDGGVAFLWGANALLIAALIRTSSRHWWAPLLACGSVSVLVTGTLGLGWAASPTMMVVNLGEAIVAATWLKRDPKAGELMASLSWFGRFVLAMIAGPVVMAPLVGLTIGMLGGDPLNAMWQMVFGHALGNLALTPIAYMLTGRAAQRETRRILSQRKKAAAILLPTVALVSLLTFWQTSWPLLFLPVMWIVFATFRLGRLGAAVSLALLTTIGGILTVRGLGPITLTGAPTGERMQFFQFYLAATVLTILPIAADLHGRRALVRSLRRSEAEFRLLAEHCTDVIMRISPDGIIRYASPSMARLTGHDPERLIGMHSRTLIDERDFPRVIGEHRATLAAGGEPRRYSYRSQTVTGETRWFSTHARALLDEDGEAVELLAFIRDVTAGKENEKEWVQAALTDSLTGLPNRRALERRAADRTKAAGRDCIALFDLDRFKMVNDTYGHDAGDAVLKGFAEVAGRMIRSNDVLARLGGEEFVFLFENTSVERAYQVCDRIRRVLAATPLATPAGGLRVTVSGGVAILGEDGLEAALRLADEALYRAKRAGRDRLLLAA